MERGEEGEMERGEEGEMEGEMVRGGGWRGGEGRESGREKGWREEGMDRWKDKGARERVKRREEMMERLRFVCVWRTSCTRFRFQRDKKGAELSFIREVEL